VPEGMQIPIVLNDSNGNQVYSQTVTLSAYGTFSGQYTLGPAVPLGNYSLGINSQGSGIYVGTGFLVAEYRKPEYLVGVTAGQPSYVNGDTIQANVAATLRRTHGRSRVTREMKPMLSSRASSSSRPCSKAMPAACSASPPPAASGFGSRIATTTRRTFALMSASTHGGVRPR